MMTIHSQYAKTKARLLNDLEICPENRSLFAEFFKFEEYKLKRVNRLPELDAASVKTVLDYVYRLRTVNTWFGNRPWASLTRQDIQEVYDALEDGRIVSRFGKPYKALGTYYRKILCSKPFEPAGKREIAREVVAYGMPRHTSEVRFVREPDFRKLVDVASRIEYRCLLWLAFDVGENVSSLLKLRASDFRREANPDTGEPEYSVQLRREVLKRSRLPRTEITHYPETVALLDLVLPNVTNDQPIFRFGPRMAAKMLQAAAQKTGVRCLPNGELVTLKDLRSSMACDLFSKGWTTDEVNRRLGHKPSSREIDKYVNWLAVDRHRSKKRLSTNKVETLVNQLDTARDREQLLGERVRTLQQEVASLKSRLDANNRIMFEQVRRLLTGASEQGLIVPAGY